MINFAYPYLWLLVLLPPIVYYILPSIKGVHGDALRIPFLKDLLNIKNKSGSIWVDINNNKFNLSKILLIIIYIFLVAAVARPRWVGEPIRVKNEGRDIILVLDISTSMLETDFTYQGHYINRLQAVKIAATDFISKRMDDRIGLILFGTQAYLQAPLTFDKNAVTNILMSMDAGMAGRSTAIGDALGLALKSVKDGDGKDNKVIILLSDGENNDGSLSIPQVINLAKNENIKIYTIGVGNSNNFIQSILSYKMQLPSGLDEAGLQAIAQEAGGQYFRAEDTSGLIGVYQAIDKLEPQSREKNYVQEIKEYYYIPLLIAFFLAVILMMLKRRRGV